MRNMENEEYGKCGVWKMRSMENVEYGKCGVFFVYTIKAESQRFERARHIK